jgi:hypothetical protein
MIKTGPGCADATQPINHVVANLIGDTWIWLRSVDSSKRAEEADQPGFVTEGSGGTEIEPMYRALQAPRLSEFASRESPVGTC